MSRFLHRSNHDLPSAAERPPLKPPRLLSIGEAPSRKRPLPSLAALAAPVGSKLARLAASQSASSSATARTEGTRSLPSGPRIVAARITDLKRPDANPLGGITVEDVHAFFSRAGIVEKIVCASSPKTGPPLAHVDALVQFRSPAVALQVVDNWSGRSLSGDEDNLMSIQFSRHTELTVHANNRCKDYTPDLRAVLPPARVAPRPSSLKAAPRGNHRRVVLAHCTPVRNPELNPLGGLRLEDVHSVFSTIGPVQKIVCSSVPKTGPPLSCIDAMVQFQHEEDAERCLSELEGHSVTSDDYFCMNLEYSRLEELHVQRNNDRCWDYSASISNSAKTSSNSHASSLASPRNGLNGHARQDKSLTPKAKQERRVVIAHVTRLYHPEQNPLGGLTVEIVHSTFSACGFVEKIVCSTSPKTGPPLSCVDAMVQFETAEAANIALSIFNNRSLTDDDSNFMEMELSVNLELQVKANNNRAWDFTLGYVESRSHHGPIGAATVVPEKIYRLPADEQPSDIRVVAAHINDLLRPEAVLDSLFSLDESMPHMDLPRNARSNFISVITGYNLMTIQGSDRTELQVKANNKRSWDYTVEPSSAEVGGMAAYGAC